MIRNLLIITVVSFLAAVVCLTGAVALGIGDQPWSKFHSKREWSFDDGAAPEGERTSREFAWNGADTLVVNLPAKVRYTQGPDAKVTVTAPRSLLDRLTFERGEIGLQNGRHNLKNSHIEIVVQAPGVKIFRFNGGEDVEIDGFAQDSLTIEANGAVDLEARGTARTLDLRINGAGEADLEEVVNEVAKVELNGAGKASLAPTKSVDIRINGVGHVSLSTNPPVVNKEIHGIGSVTTVSGGDVENDDEADRLAPPAARPRAKPVGTET